MAFVGLERVGLHAVGPEIMHPGAEMLGLAHALHLPEYQNLYRNRQPTLTANWVDQVGIFLRSIQIARKKLL